MALIAIFGSALLALYQSYNTAAVELRGLKVENEALTEKLRASRAEIIGAQDEARTSRARLPLLKLYSPQMTMYKRYHFRRESNAVFEFGQAGQAPYLKLQITGWSGTGDDAIVNVLMNAEDSGMGVGARNARSGFPAKPGCGLRLLTSRILYEIKIEGIDTVDTLTMGIAAAEPAPRKYAEASPPGLIDPGCDPID